MIAGPRRQAPKGERAKFPYEMLWNFRGCTLHRFREFSFEAFLNNYLESDALFHNLTVEASFESLMVYFPILVAHILVFFGAEYE
jgi:hypothetical protein